MRDRVRQVHAVTRAHFSGSCVLRCPVVMKAILLAGGKGTRLRPLTLHTPKPIVPIFDRPFLRYQIDLLRQVPEIDEIVLSLNYQPRRIEEVFGDGSDLGIHLRYVVEPTPLGTGRRHQVRGRRGPGRADRRVQRRRVHVGGPAGGAGAASRTQGPGHHRADAGRQSHGLRPGGDRRTGQRGALRRKAQAGTDPVRHDQRRHLRARARHARPHSRRTRCTRSSAAIFRRSSQNAKPSWPTSIAATGSTSARPKNTGRRTATSWTGASSLRRSPRRPAPRWSRPKRRSRPGAIIEGPCFIDAGAVVKIGRAHRPVLRGRPSLPHRRERAHQRRHPLAEHLGRQRGAGRRRVAGRHCHFGRNVEIGGRRDLRRQVVVTDLFQA